MFSRFTLKLELSKLAGASFPKSRWGPRGALGPLGRGRDTVLPAEGVFDTILASNQLLKPGVIIEENLGVCRSAPKHSKTVRSKKNNIRLRP